MPTTDSEGSLCSASDIDMKPNVASTTPISLMRRVIASGKESEEEEGRGREGKGVFPRRSGGGVGLSWMSEGAEGLSWSDSNLIPQQV